MPGSPPHPDIPDRPGEMPRGLDAMSVGRSIFSECSLPETPVVEDYAEITFLARGGFSHVWRARHESSGALVALKIPHLTDPETAERLEEEAETLQSLDHPHIVRLLDVTTAADGAPVLVMELIEGPGLTERLPDGGFDYDHALQILLPVLAAVTHAHSRGIVHRDLKPSNILIASDGTPKVSDFGLAQSLKDQQLTFSLTRTGMLAGTVEYLAPERYEPGSESTPAADIFALGIILYELLTGRPPRGAWPPLSQIKRLDVRLDELLADAIHPDPAKRPASVEVFAQRLTAIRDSRPRYAGTPLVTRAVRITDAVWTTAGLYFLAAGFCSLLSMNNTAVPGVFDLTYNHTKLLGGYWALWVLCIGMGLVWTWQMIRLWRFRNVPLREALPSPFGLRLGHSSGAAVLVTLTQLLCAWGPLVYMVWIYSQCWFWAAPDTAPWERVLAITRWGSETPVSPWTGEPAGMFSADEFWIREMQPGLTPGTWILHDRQSFFVVTQPLLMSLGAATIVLGILATGAALVAEWKVRRWKLLGLSFFCLTALGFSLHSTVKDEQDDRLHDRRDLRWQTRIRWENRVIAEAMPHIRSLFPLLTRARSPAGMEELARLVHAAFSPVVDCSDGTLHPRDEFARLLQNSLPSENSAFVAESVRAKAIPPRHPAKGIFSVRYQAECFTSPPDGPSTGSFLTLHVEGHLSDSPPATSPPAEILTAWLPNKTPLYTAGSRALAPEEATAWLLSFCRCLSTPGCPDLESLLLPVILAPESNEKERYLPIPRETLTSSLRNSARKGCAFHLSDQTPTTIRPLTGGRMEVTAAIRIGPSPSAELVWRFETVFTGGRWQVLRLRM